MDIKVDDSVLYIGFFVIFLLFIWMRWLFGARRKEANMLYRGDEVVQPDLNQSDTEEDETTWEQDDWTHEPEIPGYDEIARQLSISEGITLSDLGKIFTFFEMPNVAKNMHQVAKSSIRLLEAEGDIGCGDSKLGGFPDLPATLGWPKNEKGNLTFIAQLNTQDFTDLDADNLLPKDRMVFFFYDTNYYGYPLGYKPEDAGGFAVLSCPLSESLYASVTPLEGEGQSYHEMRLYPSANMGLPAVTAAIQQALVLPEEAAQYMECTNMYYYLLQRDELTLHRTLGYPDALQTAPEPICQMVDDGIDATSSLPYSDGTFEKAVEKANDWVLLLQVDSDLRTQMDFRQGGRLYYFIRKQDLVRGDFGKVRGIMQCYITAKIEHSRHDAEDEN